MQIKMLYLCIIPLLLLNVRYCVGKNYSEYTLYRGVPVDDKQLDFLKSLSKSYNADYWKPPGLVNKSVQFMIGPDAKKSFLRTAEENNLPLTTVIEDVQIAFDKQTVKEYTRRRMDSFDWQSYFRLKDINAWMKDLEKAYPKSMKILNIGKTDEDRAIFAARISHPGTEKRSTVIVEGGIHAREWIAPAVVTYFMYKVLTGPESKNEQLKKISKLYEFIFVPVLNPDGYEYSHTSDRTWRKNRKDSHGVDINRNFGIAFGTAGVSLNDKTDEIYCGPRPFSERESEAMANLIQQKSDTLEYYLAFHSFGQYIIIPYAFSKKHSENYDEMKGICDTVATKIKQRYDTKYTVGSAYDTVGYLTSGVSGCWAKKQFRVPYVATFELRDQEKYGFALPPNQILPTCKETLDGMLYLLEPKTLKFSSLAHKTKTLRNCSKNYMLECFTLVLELLFFTLVRLD